MALKLNDTFRTSHKTAELITALKNIDFHKERAKSKSLKNIQININQGDQLDINRQMDFEIPVSAQKFVSNPISLVEKWVFQTGEKIDISLNIPKIQTSIIATFNFKDDESGSSITVDSRVESTIFLMSSFAEEFVSKYWKKALAQDLEILNYWIKS